MAAVVPPAGAGPDANRPIRPAATVVVLRDSARGPEVFMLRRHEASPFMGGASVFPGGRVDQTDGLEADATWCDGLDQSHIPDLPFSAAVAHRVAAIRELFEEAGILLGRDMAGRGLMALHPADRDRFASWRRELHAGTRSLKLIVETGGIRLALDALVPFARWVTPPIDVRQFDAWFFLARAPAGQTPLADEVETTHGTWITAADALARGAAGDLALPPPTWTTLRELERFSTVDAAVAWAADRRVVLRRPLLHVIAGARYLLLPGDPLHPEPWHERLPPETRFRLEPGRWAAERATS